MYPGRDDSDREHWRDTLQRLPRSIQLTGLIVGGFTVIETVRYVTTMITSIITPIVQWWANAR